MREILEETNIKVKIVRILGQRLHPDTNTDITYFLCEYVEGEEKVIDANEIKEVAYKSKNEIIRDVKTDIFPEVQKYINDRIK